MVAHKDLLVPPTKSYSAVPAVALRAVCFTVPDRGPQVVLISVAHLREFRAALEKNYRGKASKPKFRRLVGREEKFANGFKAPLFTWKEVTDPDKDPKLGQDEFLPERIGLGDLRKIAYMDGELIPEEVFISKAYLSSYLEALLCEKPKARPDQYDLVPRWATDENQVRARIMQFEWRLLTFRTP